MAAPMSSLADRHGRARIAAIGALLRAFALLAIALSVAAGWPLWTTLALAGVEGAVYAVGAPALRALAPTLVRSPSELSSANLVISLGLALAIFLGPLVGGLAYQWTGAAPVVVVVATVFALSYLRLARFEQEAPAADAPQMPDTSAQRGRIAEALAGLRTAASDDRIRLTLLVFCGYSFAVGIVDVVLIVLARDVLHQSSGGAGALYSAFGVGGLVAGVGIGRLMRARLARVFGGAVVLWAVPLGAMALVARPALALACSVAAGIAGTVAQAAGDTVLQRATPDRLMSRVLGAYEAVTGIAEMVAALVPAILIAPLGARAVLALGVATAPLVVICGWRGLRRLDRDLDVDHERLTLVARVPWLRTGSLAEQDRVAGLLEQESVPAGEVIVYQGEIGDRFYILRAGAARVLVDRREVSRLDRATGSVRSPCSVTSPALPRSSHRTHGPPVSVGRRLSPCARGCGRWRPRGVPYAWTDIPQVFWRAGVAGAQCRPIGDDRGRRRDRAVSRPNRRPQTGPPALPPTAVGPRADRLRVRHRAPRSGRDHPR